MSFIVGTEGSIDMGTVVFFVNIDSKSSWNMFKWTEITDRICTCKISDELIKTALAENKDREQMFKSEIIVLDHLYSILISMQSN